MSARRKHVTQSLHYEVEPLQENQRIVRAGGTRGGNIIEVEYPDGKQTLCMIPSKFNKKLWVRRGGFLLIEEAPSVTAQSSGASQPTSSSGASKITGSILAVLYDEHIKQFRKIPGAWPAEFDAQQGVNAAVSASDLPPSGSSSDAEDDEGEGPSTRGLNEALDAAAAAASAAGSSQQAPAAGGSGEGAAAAEGSGQGQQAQEAEHSDYESDESDDDLPPLFRNTNRKVIYHEVSDSEEEDDY